MTVLVMQLRWRQNQWSVYGFGMCIWLIVVWTVAVFIWLPWTINRLAASEWHILHWYLPLLTHFLPRVAKYWKGAIADTLLVLLTLDRPCGHERDSVVTSNLARTVYVVICLRCCVLFRIISAALCLKRELTTDGVLQALARFCWSCHTGVAIVT